MTTDGDAIRLLARLPAAKKRDIPLVDAAKLAGPGATLASLFESFTERDSEASVHTGPRERFAGVLVGEVAEREFRRRYSEVMRGQAFTLEDLRSRANETDYLVRDDHGRRAFRMNVKAHGTFFQQAAERVGLEPEDTFALATYKIRDANAKASEEALPFLFAVVSSQALAPRAIADNLPDEIRTIFDTSSLYRSFKGGRKLENLLADWLLEQPEYRESPLLTGLQTAVREAKWRVISAGRARKLMADYLFERVPALAYRNFSGNRRSQPNMHFSFEKDMLELDELLRLLRDDGLQHVATRIALNEI